VSPLRTGLGVLAISGCLLVTLVTGCKPKTATPTAAARGAKQTAFPVEVLEIGAKAHELLITAPGVVDAFERIQVTARVAGVVDKVSFVEGQEVTQGQPLAMVDSRRYALAVSSAQATVEKSSATAADSEASLKRRENAVSANPGLIPGEELETYKTKLRTAQADVDGSRESLKLARLNLEDSTVKAAAPGIIQTRTVETGQYVQAGTIIATLLRRDPMLLRFSVSTAEAPRLKVGMPVAFTLKESQQGYEAKITLVSGSADPDSRLVPVTAEIATDHKFWLRPGSFASVEVKLTSQRVYPMIPQTAARPSDHGFVAYVVDGDVAHERVLDLGLHTTDGFVEVKTGLKAGEKVVTRGVEALADGTKVRIAKVPNAQGTTPAPSASASTNPSVLTRENAAPTGSGVPAPDGSGRRRQHGDRPAGSASADGVPRARPAASGSANEGSESP
jgi:RND family efflux transporter MFP subunit